MFYTEHDRTRYIFEFLRLHLMTVFAFALLDLYCIKLCQIVLSVTVIQLTKCCCFFVDLQCTVLVYIHRESWLCLALRTKRCERGISWLVDVLMLQTWSKVIRYLCCLFEEIKWYPFLSNHMFTSAGELEFIFRCILNHKLMVNLPGGRFFFIANV